MRWELLQGTVRRASAMGAVLIGMLAASAANAQLLYSFESGVEGWTTAPFTGSDVLGISQSTSGATVGTHSLAVERGNAIGGDGNGFSWDTYISAVPASGPIRDAFLTAAADHTKYALDFDVTLTAASFVNATHIPPFFAIQIAANSSTDASSNFDQVLNVIPIGAPNGNLMNPDPNDPSAGLPKLGTHRYSVPLASSVAAGTSGLYLVPNANYYQLTFGSNLTNSLLTTVPGEGVTYFVDNVRFRRLPDQVPDTLFSWETPDDPETPVNEQLEGWTEGFGPNHQHSITTTGATDGNSALNIHRTYRADGQDFTWGSQMALTGTEPAIQDKINTLVSKIESADKIAIDVTFDPSTFDASPSYATIGFHVSDTANFFDASFPSFNPLSYTSETTLTLEMPITLLDNSAGGKLVDIGIVDGTQFLRLGISTSVNNLQIEGVPVPIDFQIDNLRIIREVYPMEGDYNADGAVDNADYVVWRKYFGTDTVLPNDPDGGMIGENQYATWKENFGAMGGGGSGSPAVPEPHAILLLAPAFAAFLSLQRRGR